MVGDVADRLRHLLAGEPEHPVVHPDARERVARGLRLRALVLVVREDEVETASVDPERRPELVQRHRRALDVPPRASAPPRRVPGRVLARLRGLPQGEVPRVLLAGVRLRVLHLVGTLAREAPVAGEARDAEVDVAVHGIGVPVSHELLHEGDDLVHRVGHLRIRVDLLQAEAGDVLEVPLARLGRTLRAGAGRRLVDLVVHVRDVVDEPHRVALRPQPAGEPREDDVGPCVPDVGALVDGRSADVHPHRLGRVGQGDDVARQRVVQAHASIVSASCASRPPSASAAGSGACCGPSARQRLVAREEGDDGPQLRATLCAGEREPQRAEIAADRLQLADDPAGLLLRQSVGRAARGAPRSARA